MLPHRTRDERRVDAVGSRSIPSVRRSAGALACLHVCSSAEVAVVC